jgi:Tol biopolymer transport system component
MTTTQVSPSFIQLGDQVKFGDAIFTVKSVESDYSGAYDFYLENASGQAHKVVTESVTLIG